MDVQMFVENAAVLFLSVTIFNLTVNFLMLLVEEYKKCSIMDRSAQKEKKTFSLRKKKRYAVLKLTDRIA